MTDDFSVLSTALVGERVTVHVSINTPTRAENWYDGRLVAINATFVWLADSYPSDPLDRRTRPKGTNIVIPWNRVIYLRRNREDDPEM